MTIKERVEQLEGYRAAIIAGCHITDDDQRRGARTLLYLRRLIAHVKQPNAKAAPVW